MTDEHDGEQRDAAVQRHRREARQGGKRRLARGEDAEHHHAGQQQQRRDPAAAHQVPDRVVGHRTASVAGQPAMLDDAAVARDEACREARAREPGRGLLAEHDRCGAGGVRVDAGRGGDARACATPRAPGARARIDDVVALDAVGAPAAHVVLDVARPPVRSAIVGPSPSRSRWSSVTRTGQPPAGGAPATAMSPPRLTSTPPPISSAMRRAARSAANALPVAPRSSSTPFGMRIVRRSRSSSTCRQLVLRRRRRTTWRRAVVRPDQREVAVVAERPQRAADRRVDGSSGRLGRAQRASRRPRRGRC